MFISDAQLNKLADVQHAMDSMSTSETEPTNFQNFLQNSRRNKIALTHQELIHDNCTDYRTWSGKVEKVEHKQRLKLTMLLIITEVYELNKTQQNSFR